MSTVRIPPVLRVSTGGQKLIDTDGMTVGEVLTTLVATHAGLGGQLFGAGGDLNRFMTVFLTDTDIRHLQILATPVTELDTIVLLPAMAGGCSSAGVGSMDQNPARQGALR